MLRRDPLPVKSGRGKTKTKGAARNNTFENESDNRLWEALRNRRRELAAEQGVPPYVVFHDATLTEMVRRRPLNLSEFAAISGVGERKLDAYGEDFLDVIQAHANDTNEPVSDTAAETLQLFRLGLDVPTIAARRGLKATTIYSHLTQAIARGEVDLREVVPLDDAELTQVREALRATGGKALKPAFEVLGGRYPYEVLRCVLAEQVATA